MSNAKTPPQLTYADLVCVDDLDPYMGETTSDLQNYEQDIYHRLGEPFGSNLDDPDAGAGLESVLSSSQTASQIQNRIVTEVRKDPRTTDASCVVSDTSANQDGSELTGQLEADTDDDHLSSAIGIDSDGLSLGGGGA